MIESRLKRPFRSLLWGPALLCASFLGGAFGTNLGRIASAIAQTAVTPFTHGLAMQQAASGQPLDTNPLHDSWSFNYINVADGIAAGSTPDAESSGLLVNDWIKPEATGNHAAVRGQISIDSPPQESGYYVGMWGFARATVSLGGTNTGSGARGKLFGINPQAAGTNSAANLWAIVGAEVDVSCSSGCSTRDKIGLNVTTIGNDAIQGVAQDAAIIVGSDKTSPGWRTGLLFNTYNGGSPIASNGTVIGAVGPWKVTHGLDFSNITCSADCFRGPLVTPPSSSSPCSTGGIIWDQNFIYVCIAPNIWKRTTLSSF